MFTHIYIDENIQVHLHTYKCVERASVSLLIIVINPLESKGDKNREVMLCNLRGYTLESINSHRLCVLRLVCSSPTVKTSIIIMTPC